jgi:sulfite reductase (NADPH) flavoprotein alpha-component
MTISVWRYSHLALAISSFIFLLIASLTGIVLSLDTISQQLNLTQSVDLHQLHVAETMPILQKNYSEIVAISVDKNQQVILQGSDLDGNDVQAIVNLATGKKIGIPEKQSEWIQWVTALHRSLFLHELGRFFIGITAFILSLITVSGIVLVVQRQQGVRRFFAKIVNDRVHLAQHWHVVLGRIALIPIFIIALTGTYLSMVRFEIFPENKVEHSIDFVETETALSPRNTADFAIFQNTRWSDVQSIEFPFSDDPEDYYTLKLSDRELVVDQFSGEVLGAVKYPFTAMLTTLSLKLHTGEIHVIWALVLLLACFNILFFIYSGFAITLKRKRHAVRNVYTAEESEYILLVGSENGSTLRFANAIHHQLLAKDHKSYVTELNNYSLFPNAKHLIVLTCTHGVGTAPSNARKLPALIKDHPQLQSIQVSVVGFGSRKYKDFCGYAFEVEKLFAEQSWADVVLKTHTVDDKSGEQFTQWVHAWSEQAELSLNTSLEQYQSKPKGLKSVVVTKKTDCLPDQIFTLTLRTRFGARFSSGDLLAIYPGEEGKERLYSIGKVKGAIQLLVKLHAQGLGSGYLHDLTSGERIQARIIKNKSFHFPINAPVVAMIANGTGIAPFLGMISENNSQIPTHLYAGYRTAGCLPSNHLEALQAYVERGKLKHFHLALSREAARQRVTHLVAKDVPFFAQVLQTGGVIMICGSLAMQQDVMQILTKMVEAESDRNLSYYVSNGQILTDCY